MQINTRNLLKVAREHHFAVGAFNIYNLEGATAVIRAAEALGSPVILQLLPAALSIGGSPLIALCDELAIKSTVPVAVHLDHCSNEETIRFALDHDLHSIMADGSDLDFAENIAFTRRICSLVAEKGGSVEAELGKLSGNEDGITVADREARLTSPEDARSFVEQVGVSALAVCIGNVHGQYSSRPQLDFERLRAISEAVSIPLVLHGTSGLPDEMITQAISLGVCKFNVNTEVRTKYLETMARSFANSSTIELVPLMKEVISAMMEPVQAKIKLFCSANKADLFNTLYINQPEDIHHRRKT